MANDADENHRDDFNPRVFSVPRPWMGGVRTMNKYGKTYWPRGVQEEVRNRKQPRLSVR